MYDGPKILLFLVQVSFNCSRNFWRCLEIRLPIRSGQEVKWLRLMARRKVLGTELKHNLLRY